MTKTGVFTQTSRHHVALEGDFLPFSATLTSERLADGLDLVHLRLRSESPMSPQPMRVVLRHPAIQVFARWHPAVLHARHLPPDWGDGFTSDLARNAPVVCLYSADGTNQLTMACSDAFNPLRFRVGVQEESAEVRCRVQLFERPHPPIAEYDLQLLLDTRPLPYHRILNDVQKWWASLPACEPRAVPEAARLPMYSTWYSFHQNIETQAVLEQCRMARELGCEALIVDDGWQTSDNRRGYAYAGDWHPDRIGDMRGFVNDVHEAGMKFLLWYSLPLVGNKTEAFKRFEGKLLTSLNHLQAGVLDPRYPEVREHLVRTLERAVSEWKLDGFKLDFIDELAVRHARELQPRPGMDHVSVSEATFRLMEDIFDRLHLINPDIMVEFRQEYIGPVMRRFGNMFRAGDCPNDPLTNRLRTIDVRLLCGNTACHSDMLMWHPQDSVESAALQMLGVLFSVPQLSVRLDGIPANHLAMLRFWLSIWREHRDVLLDGEFQPQHPETLYPLVVAGTERKRVAAVYQDMIVKPGSSVPAQLLIVNATLGNRVALELCEDLGERRLETFTCAGKPVVCEKRSFARGIHVLDIPPAGLARVCV